MSKSYCLDQQLNLTSFEYFISMETVQFLWKLPWNNFGYELSLL